MSLEPWQWAVAVLAALLIGVSKTGFAGVGILFVALFANVFPSAKVASGVVLPLLIVADVVAVGLYRRHMQWHFFWKLFPWAAAGIVAGFFTMSRIDDTQMRVMTGGIVVALTALHVWRRRQAARAVREGREPDPLPMWFGPLLGVLAGFTTLVANAAGPLVTIYFLAMRLPKMEFVGTNAVFFMAVNWFKLPFMSGLGLVGEESLGFTAVLVPVVLAGTLVGKWLLARVNQEMFETLMLVLGALSGLKLMWG
ncbi:MAG: sulfite exporter TauE/SafE family protein [Puniceicoccales bacterium]|nr:sulfite exporter TauE/SafE family protein [Puniceicoccales bacterium]